MKLEAALRHSTPVFFLFNYDDSAKFEVAQPIRCRIIAFLLLIRYLSLRPKIVHIYGVTDLLAY